MNKIRKISFALIAAMLLVGAYAVSWQTLSENQSAGIYQIDADSIGLPLALLLAQTMVILIGAAIALWPSATFANRKTAKCVALVVSTLMSIDVVIFWFDRHHIEIVIAYSFTTLCTVIFYFFQKNRAVRE
jgi:hypothetical protein